LARLQGDDKAAHEAVDQAQDLARGEHDRTVIAWALEERGRLKNRLGDPVSARELFRESLAQSQEIGDARAVARCLVVMPEGLLQQHELIAARDLWEEAGSL